MKKQSSVSYFILQMSGVAKCNEATSPIPMLLTKKLQRPPQLVKFPLRLAWFCSKLADVGAADTGAKHDITHDSSKDDEFWRTHLGSDVGGMSYYFTHKLALLFVEFWVNTTDNNEASYPQKCPDKKHWRDKKLYKPPPAIERSCQPPCDTKNY